jgi:hypothetical protein|uniref:DNA-binding protein S1FA n=1 Tax=Picea sitchensis TaxID=3332 RepID=A9NTB9_PICSI|nr:unknown [Picea sitchensis]
MEEDFSSQADIDPSAFASQERLLTKAAGRGFNPGLIVLLVVVGVLLVFIVGNYVLYMYAQKTLPPKKKKPVSKKKMKREKLKQGISAPGE